MRIELKRYEDLDATTHRAVLALRNSDRVRLVSFNKAPITREEHLRWVESLRKRRDAAYYAVFREEEFLGSLSFTAIDRVTRTMEWGVAFREEAMFVPALVIFDMLDRAFSDWDLAVISLAVQPTNDLAMRMNRRFGFRETGSRCIEGDEYLEMSITAAEWHERRPVAELEALRTLRGRADIVWKSGPLDVD